MSAVRKPRARALPESLRALVLDLDARLQGGDGLSDVMLPHDEWAPIVEAAQEEHERELDADGGMQSSVDVGEFDRELESLRAFKAATEKREAVFSSTPPGVEAWRDTQQVRLLLESGDGCIVSLEQGLELAIEIDRACSAAKSETPPKKKRSRSKVPCEHCGEDDGHTPDECFLKPQGTAVKFDPVPPAKKKKRQALDTSGMSRTEARLARLKDPAHRRAAARAVGSDSVIVCHGCGATISDNTGGLGTHEDTKGRRWPGTHCSECRAAYRKAEAEGDAHDAAIEAIGAAGEEQLDLVAAAERKAS